MRPPDRWTGTRSLRARPRRRPRVDTPGVWTGKRLERTPRRQGTRAAPSVRRVWVDAPWRACQTAGPRPPGAATPAARTRRITDWRRRSPVRALTVAGAVRRLRTGVAA